MDFTLSPTQLTCLGPHWHSEPFSPAQDHQRRRCIERLVCEQTMQVIDATHRLVSKRHDDVALSNVCPAGGALRIDGNRQHTALRGQLMKPDQASVERNVLSANAQVASRHTTISQQRGHDDFGGLDRDREAEPLAAHDDRRVDANHLPGGVDEWPA